MERKKRKGPIGINLSLSSLLKTHTLMWDPKPNQTCSIIGAPQPSSDQKMCLTYHLPHILHLPNNAFIIVEPLFFFLGQSLVILNDGKPNVCHYKFNEIY